MNVLSFVVFAVLQILFLPFAILGGRYRWVSTDGHEQKAGNIADCD
jgi:hypothetical protein